MNINSRVLGRYGRLLH